MRRTAAVVLAALVAITLLVGSAASAQTDASTVDCSYPVLATDATGTAIAVQEEPERVTVLAPSAAQTMWEIGAQDKVVGMPVNPFTAYLEGSEERTNVVGERGQPIQERVLATNPDLVLAPNIIPTDTVESLREALPDDTAVYRFAEATSLEDVAAKTELTGRLVGSFDSAAATAAELRGQVSAVADTTAGADRPTVYYALGGGFTAGTQTFIGNLIDATGGNNIAGAANITGYAPISQEIIAAEDPDWIVVNQGMSVPKNPAVNDSTAIKEGNILKLNANYLNQPAPRVTIPLLEMATAFHPDAADESTIENAERPEPTRCRADVSSPTTTTTSTTSTADPSTTITQPPTTETTTTTTTATATTTDGEGPGFGVGVALVALLAAAGAFARRD